MDIKINFLYCTQTFVHDCFLDTHMLKHFAKETLMFFFKLHSISWICRSLMTLLLQSHTLTQANNGIVLFQLVCCSQVCLYNSDKVENISLLQLPLFEVPQTHSIPFVCVISHERIFWGFNLGNISLSNSLKDNEYLQHQNDAVNKSMGSQTYHHQLQYILYYS